MVEGEIVDACIHQWTLDYEKMSDIISEPWSTKLKIKSKIMDPASGTLIPTLPWYHDYWGVEDLSASEKKELRVKYKSPRYFDQKLEDAGVEYAILLGHEIKFLPAIFSPEFKSEIAAAYNSLLKDIWLDSSDRFKGAILAPLSNPEAAVREIKKYESDDDMVSILVYSGGELPLGHEQYHPIYEAAAEYELPLIIHSSANAQHRQTAGGLPEYYVTYDTNMMQNHMINMANMILRGVFDKYPALVTVWMGEGVGWHLQPKWRATRYYRNLEPQVPVELEQEPMDYVDDHCYFGTYPIEQLPSDHLENLIEMTGPEKLIYSSGLPHWNSDSRNDFPEMASKFESSIFCDNAKSVFKL